MAYGTIFLPNWGAPKIQVPIPTVTDAVKKYNGSPQSPTIGTYDSTLVSVSGDSQTELNDNWAVVFSLIDPMRYEWEDSTVADKVFQWKITKGTPTFSLSTNNLNIGNDESGAGTIIVTTDSDGEVVIENESSYISADFDADNNAVMVYSNSCAFTGSKQATFTVYQAEGTNHLATSPITVNVTITENNLVSLLKFENSATYDECGNTWTDCGAAQISNDTGYSGDSSFYCYSASTRIKMADNSILPELLTDCTIDFWVNWSSTSDGGPMYIGTESGSDSAQFIEMFSFYQIYIYHGSSKSISALNRKNQWLHCAFVLSGGQIKCYVDGVLRYTWNLSYNHEATNYIWLNCGRTPGRYFTGYIDDFRITRGARWTGNFTPPEAA